MLNVPFLDRVIGVYTVGNLQIEARLWQAGVILFLVFMLLFTLARLRYLYVHWNLGKSALAFLVYGFLLAIILEGFLLIAGKTFVTEILGWKNAPKPISTALDLGHDKLVDVLGAEETASTKEKILTDYRNLNPNDAEGVRLEICKLE